MKIDRFERRRREQNAKKAHSQTHTHSSAARMRRNKKNVKQRKENGAELGERGERRTLNVYCGCFCSLKCVWTVERKKIERLKRLQRFRAGERLSVRTQNRKTNAQHFLPFTDDILPILSVPFISSFGISIHSWLSIQHPHLRSMFVASFSLNAISFPVPPPFIFHFLDKYTVQSTQKTSLDFHFILFEYFCILFCAFPTPTGQCAPLALPPILFFGAKKKRGIYE